MQTKALLLAAVVSLSAPLVYAETDPDAAIQYRKGVFSAMEWNLSRLAAMVQGRVEFDAEVFEQRSERLVLLSRIAGEGFADPAGSRGERVETRASWRIWDAKPRFDEQMSELQTRLETLNQAAEQGQDGRALRPLVARVAQSCKACHDRFRD
jgi:cytochrome c556